jgi:ABC-type branched-subunit amino acid transport system substrate-binding protein
MAQNRQATWSRKPRRALLDVLVVIGLCLLTACGGSALSPETVRDATIALNGGAVPGAYQTTSGSPGDLPVAGNPTPGTNDPGANPGAGPSTGSGPRSNGNTSIPPAASGIKSGSCAGFKNQTGVTDKEIRISNISDISGPFPGLFAATQQAMKAYVAYFNATSSICGRKLSLDAQDSRTDAGANQQAYTKACGSSFAAVGSMSGFDSGAAATAEKCGIPDIRTAMTSLDVNACRVCFGALASGRGQFQNQVYDFWRKQNAAATNKAALLYLNAGSAAETAKTMTSVGKQRGMNWLYIAPIDVAEFNYGPYVQQLKSKGVQFVQFVGAPIESARLAMAMQSAGYKPQVFMLDASNYDQALIKQAGGAVEGTKLFINFTPFEESQPELNIYKRWLQQVSPGAQPTMFGLFAWSAAKLFVEKSIALGGKLSRTTLLQAVGATHSWTANGLTAPMDIGGKHPPTCLRWLQIKDGKFVPYGATKYTCGSYSNG